MPPPPQRVQALCFESYKKPPPLAPFDLSRSHGRLAVADSAVIGRELSRNEHSQPASFKPRVQRGEQARVLKAATPHRDDSEARIRRDSRRERVGRGGEPLLEPRGKLRH